MSDAPAPPAPEITPPPPAPGGVGKGVGRAAIAFAIAAAVSLLAAAIPLTVIGVLQLCWIIPMSLHFSKKGESQTVKGLWIAAGITFLLNATCWGVLLAGLSSANFH